MRAFAYFQPTEIRFGCGRLAEVGEAVARYGKRCLLVTVPMGDYLEPVVATVAASLDAAGVAMSHFDGVVPNPTTDCVTAGADMAKVVSSRRGAGSGRWF